MPPKKIKAEIINADQIPFLYRFIVIGDIHLRRTDPLGIIGENGLNTRLEDKLSALSQAITLAVSTQATHICLLGDIFDAINPSETLKRLFWECMKPAIDVGVQIRIIIGNHDRTGQMFNFSGDEPIMPTNVAMIKHDLLTETLNLPNRKEPFSIKYIPFKSSAEIVEDLKKVSDVTLGHFEVKGAILAPDNHKLKNEIDMSTVKDSLIWLGHIHKHQEFAENFAYIGSCVQCDFAEVTEKKVFGSIDVFPDGQFTTEYHEIIQRPMHQINIQEDDDNNMYISENIPAHLKEAGVLIKFKLIGSPEWIKAIDKTRFKKRFPNAIRVAIDDVKLDIDRQKSDTPTTTFKMEDRVHMYLSEKKKPKDYLAKGLELAKEAHAYAEEVE